MCVELPARGGCTPILPGGGLAWSQAVLQGATGLSVTQPSAMAMIDPLGVTALRAALEHAHITALYQPVVRLDNCRPCSIEVLARLQHPEHGTLLPHLFVPGMEEAGLAAPFTAAVFRRAFSDWGNGRLDRLGMSIALNVPLDVLLESDTLAALDEIRAADGIAAGQVVIELTESQPVIRVPELRSAATRLRAMGYGLAIDDISPTVRDHRVLLDMPFTVMKLDKDLVQDAQTDPEARAFLVAAIADGRRAGLTIIAEGIENEASWALMQRLGVDLAQGFMVSYPLPATAIGGWHTTWSSLQGL